MIDTHAHLDFENYNDDRDKVIKRFFKGGGKAIVNIGVDFKRNKKVIKLAQENEKLFAVIGFHPEGAGRVAVSEVKTSLVQLLKEKEENKIVAIGEIGLDYFHNQENKKEQKELFQSQLDLAIKYSLPVVVHCRDAYKDVLKILKKPQYKELKVVMHCYMGNQKQTRDFLQLPNLYFSFTGNITFADFGKYKNGKLVPEKAEIFRVIEQIPLEKIMAETDCPFLAPNPHRGKRNEPVFVREVIKRLAKIKGLGFEEAERKTDDNAITFFKLFK
ncbi:MAG TPA: TatD family hydrolase [Candidatus Moranbacteria bacterium]|nr:TatD family hydrolase [Candidatus Moranbacteria bacterium]